MAPAASADPPPRTSQDTAQANAGFFEGGRSQVALTVIDFGRRAQDLGAGLPAPGEPEDTEIGIQGIDEQTDVASRERSISSDVPMEGSP